MSIPSVISDPSVVASILESMALTESTLRDSVFQAYLHRVRLTPNHPPSFPGLEMWGWTVASLREQLASSGWVAINFGNYSVTVHDSLPFAINVASGDEATGVPGSSPNTRSKKGVNTSDAVLANSQQDWLAELLPEKKQKAEPASREFTTWLLLHFIDSKQKEIRIELSLPTAIDDGGWVTRWENRIMLKPISFDGDPIPNSMPPPVDPEINIRRKM